MRKLASIKKISNLLPIEGKDRISLAVVDGWSVIVKKDEFQVGDKCVYIEIDSVLPEREEFEFLRSKDFRIKTMKMAGVLSQGICFPLKILPEKVSGEYEIDEDVTDLIGVKQYEPTMDTEKDVEQNHKKRSRFLMRFAWYRKIALPQMAGNEFPSFISKTDETRIQNMPFILKDKRGWVATEKIDGQSGTFCLVRHKRFFGLLSDRFEYIVCSRNRRVVKDDGSSYWSVSDRYRVEEFLHSIIGDSDWVAVQGECIAPKVQGNKYKVDVPDLFIFNVVYPEGRMDSLSAKRCCENGGLKFVPIVDENYVLPDTVGDVLDYAHGQSAIGETLREGIVFRSQDGKQSFKAVDPRFLIKYDE